MDGGRTELTLGFTEQFNGEQTALGDFPLGPGPNLQVWADGHLSRRFILGGGLFAGLTGSVGGGLGARFVAYDRAPVLLGVDVQGGWMWAEVGVPVSWTVDEDIVLYAEPSVGLRLPGLVRMEVGGRFRFFDGFGLVVAGDLEVGSGDRLSFDGAPIGEAVSVGLAFKF